MANYNMTNMKARFETAKSTETRSVLKPVPVKQAGIGRAQIAPFSQTTQSKTDEGDDRKIDAKRLLSKKLAFTIEHQTSYQSSTAHLKSTDNNSISDRSNHMKATLNSTEKSNTLKSDVLSSRVKPSKDDVQENKVISGSFTTNSRLEGADSNSDHSATLSTDSRTAVTTSSFMKISIRPPRVANTVNPSTAVSSSGSSMAGRYTLQNHTNTSSATTSMPWTNTCLKTANTVTSGTMNSNMWQTNSSISTSVTTTTNSNTRPIQTNTITPKALTSVANSLSKESTGAKSPILSKSSKTRPRNRNLISPSSVKPSTASENTADFSVGECTRNSPHPRPRVNTPHSPSSNRHAKPNQNDQDSVMMRSATHGGSITRIKDTLSKKSSYEKTPNSSWKDRTSRKYGDGKFKNILKSFEQDVDPSKPVGHCTSGDHQDKTDETSTNVKSNTPSKPISDDEHLKSESQAAKVQTGVKTTKPTEAWIVRQPKNKIDQAPVTRKRKPVVVKYKPQKSKEQASSAKDPDIHEEMTTACKDSDHAENTRLVLEARDTITENPNSDGDESDADSEGYDDIHVVKGLKCSTNNSSTTGDDWPETDTTSDKKEEDTTFISQKPIQTVKNDLDGNSSSASEGYPYENIPHPKENLHDESPGSESDSEDNNYDDVLPVFRQVMHTACQLPIQHDQTESIPAEAAEGVPDDNPLDSVEDVLNKEDMPAAEEIGSDYEIPCKTQPNEDEETETKWNPSAVTKPFRREKYSRKGRYGVYHLPVTPCDNPDQENLNKSVGSTTDSGELSDSSEADYEPVADAAIYADVDNEVTQIVDTTPLPQVANKGKIYKLSKIKLIQQIRKRVKKAKPGKKGIPSSSSNPNLSALQILPHNASNDSLDGQVTQNNNLDICDLPICNSEEEEDSESSMSRSTDRRSLRANKPLPALPVEDQPPSLDELPPKLPPKRNPSIHGPPDIAPPAVPPRTPQRSISSDSNSEILDINLVVPLPVKRRSREYYDSNSSKSDSGGQASYRNYPSSGAHSQYDQGSPVINPRASLPRYIDPSEVASIPEPRPSPKFDQSDPNSWADIEYIDVLDDEDVYGITRKRYHSTYFLEEPLYQHYTKDRNSRDKEYMEIDPFEMDKSPTESLQGSDLTATLTRLAPGMGMRTMWSKMPQVAESNILDKITPKERKVQEAIFEIITSEASYLKSMNVVIDHFVKAPEFYDEAMPECILEKHDQHALFSNIGAVRDASERFLEDLEAQWMQNVKIDDIGHILRKHSEKNFNVYIVYCSNQAFQTKKLQELMQRPSFKDAVLRLQQSPACSGLPLDSFLLLPMQRITRLPLLIDTICHRLEPDTERHRSSFIALQKLNGLVKKCNEGVRKMQQTEQMVILKKQIEFKIRQVPLVSANRFLVKQGDLIKIGNESNNWLPGLKAKPTKVPIYLILFNDLLLVSKKKNNGQFVVTDHCQRNSLELVPLDGDIKQYCPLGVPTGCSNLFLMVMLENHEEKQVDMILSCSSSAERVRWIDACTPVKEEQEGEKIYEDWDCPQVQAIKMYIAQEPDEMTLNESDVINVTRKIDKWYEGERLRDSERGWFPADCCKEIINTHVRARNLRQAYRMKSFSIDESNFKGK